MFRTSALLVVSSTAASAVATSVELEGASASVVLDVDGTSPVIVNKAYLDALATDAEVASAVAPLATSAEVASAVAPLATSAEVAAAVAPLATSAEVASAVAPLATSAEVASAVAPLATSAEVDSKIEAYDTRNNDCPNGSLDSYGVCIWHVGTYDKNVVEAEAACAAVEGGRLCYTSEVWQAWEKGAQVTLFPDNLSNFNLYINPYVHPFSGALTAGPKTTPPPCLTAFRMTKLVVSEAFWIPSTQKTECSTHVSFSF